MRIRSETLYVPGPSRVNFWVSLPPAGRRFVNDGELVAPVVAGAPLVGRHDDAPAERGLDGLAGLDRAGTLGVGVVAEVEGGRLEDRPGLEGEPVRDRSELLLGLVDERRRPDDDRRRAARAAPRLPGERPVEDRCSAWRRRRENAPSPRTSTPPPPVAAGPRSDHGMTSLSVIWEAFLIESQPVPPNWVDAPTAMPVNGLRRRGGAVARAPRCRSSGPSACGCRRSGSTGPPPGLPRRTRRCRRR